MTQTSAVFWLYLLQNNQKASRKNVESKQQNNKNQLCIVVINLASYTKLSDRVDNGYIGYIEIVWELNAIGVNTCIRAE